MKKSYANQRNITIHKEPTNKFKIYTVNDNKSMFEAMENLTSQVGFKLYMYLASNRDNYNMNLSSEDFCEKANCGMTAYRTAFAELEENKYLIPKPDTQTVYAFYDKARNEDFEFEEVEEKEREPKTMKVLKVAILDEKEEKK